MECNAKLRNCIAEKVAEKKAREMGPIKPVCSNSRVGTHSHARPEE